MPLWETELEIKPGAAPLRFSVEGRVRRCPLCRRVYDHDATFCNYCEIDISNEAPSTLVTKNDKELKQKTRQKNKAIRIASGVMVLLVVILYFLLMADWLLFVIAGLIIIFATTAFLPDIANIKSRDSSLESEYLKKITLLLEIDDRPPIILLRRFVRDSTIESPLLLSRSGYFAETLTIFSATLLKAVYSQRIDSRFFDKLIKSSDYWFLTFETHLSDELKNIGPFIAIQDPNTYGEVPNEGAIRIKAKSDWQTKVVYLIDCSRLLILILDNSLPMRWELDNLLSRKEKYRIILIPLLYKKEEIEFYKKQYDELRESYPLLPEYNSQLAGFRIASNSEILEPIILERTALRGECIVQKIAEIIAEWHFQEEWQHVGHPVDSLVLAN